MAAVTIFSDFGASANKVCHCFHCFSIYHEVMGPDAMILVFWMLICVDHNKLWKILKEMGTPDHLTCLMRNLYAGQEATVRTRYEQWTGSKLGKEYVKAVYCHLAYLTSMQSTSREALDWKKHKLESRLLGEISITSDMQMTPPLWQKMKRN